MQDFSIEKIDIFATRDCSKETLKYLTPVLEDLEEAKRLGLKTLSKELELQAKLVIAVNSLDYSKAFIFQLSHLGDGVDDYYVQRIKDNGKACSSGLFYIGVPLDLYKGEIPLGVLKKFSTDEAKKAMAFFTDGTMLFINGMPFIFIACPIYSEGDRSFWLAYFRR